MFSRDFTGHYTLPNGRRDDQYQSLGSYARFMTYGGPMSEVPNHTWAEAEMTPERLIGPATTTAILAATPNGAAASTYPSMPTMTLWSLSARAIGPWA
ncbi:hypothetical protein G6F59_017607 [Rhizopus arrhizus]|nr:hypothetical protein G6F59_017607 [Rhizopus arrhizus]